MLCSWETICSQESCDFEVDLILGILAGSELLTSPTSKAVFLAHFANDCPLKRTLTISTFIAITRNKVSKLEEGSFISCA
jgi:hypothetical protein